MTKRYSNDGVEFNHDTIDEALADLLDTTPQQPGAVISLWEGERVTPLASQYLPDVSRLLDWLSDEAYSAAPDYDFDWPKCTDGQKTELGEQLKALVDRWADKHNLQPPFGHVENIKTRTIKLLNGKSDYEIE
jgi:hypothetical protein